MFDPVSPPVQPTLIPQSKTKSPLIRGLLSRLSPTPKDWLLWQQACEGNARSASALVKLLTPQALAMAMQILHQHADAEDVVQESFLRLWGRRPSSDRGASLATYFNTIVINRCKSFLMQRRELLTEPDALTDLSDALQPQQSFDTHDLELTERLQKVMHGLPPRQRMALSMWAYADASVPEIAIALEIDNNAAHQLLHRAKQTIKKQLTQGERP